MKLDTNEDILQEARDITEFEGRDLRKWLYREILLNALKTKRDELDILDLKVVSRTMDEFRYAARVFKPYRSIRKVSIFGSARVPEGEPHYKMATDFGHQMADQGFMAITGAASGIMKAGIDGAGEENSFGVNILLPFETPTTVMQDDPKSISFHFFFTRKLFFVMEADACALFPGLLSPRLPTHREFWSKLLGAGTSVDKEIRHSAHLTALQTVLTKPAAEHYQRLPAAACLMSTPALRVAEIHKGRPDR